jgi:AcrR family transcriptional regulator
VFPDCFAEAIMVVAGNHGYTETSVEQVLQESGSSRGAFYRRYNGKLECFLAGYAVAVEQVAARLAAAAQRAGPAPSRVRAALVELVALVEEQPEVCRALLVEVHAAGPEGQARKVANTHRAARALEEGLAAGGEGEGEAAFVAVGIVGAIEMAVQARLERDAVSELRELMPDLVQFALAPYVGAQTATQEMQWARRDCVAGLVGSGLTRQA